MERIAKGLSTKMGADKSAENTPNATKFLCPICLPKPKLYEFSKKSSLCVSVIRDDCHSKLHFFFHFFNF